MSDGNGKPPIPFRAPNTIPIIGQPYTLKGGFATVQVVCQCEAKEPVLLVGGNPGFCPACARGFVIITFAFDVRTGQVTVNLGLVRQEPQKPALTVSPVPELEKVPS